MRYLVEDAVTRQLVSDVPLCTFLSGGLDSSIITALAARNYQAAAKLFPPIPSILPERQVL
ncbi:asparagine synthase-related protein [Clostridium sp. KNHs216]|uniref:asparagine synthase-related protein n=1 Tax=Clostridium sp. KNHs216 TaxID=1550235 RepID=UPI00325B03CF